MIGDIISVALVCKKCGNRIKVVENSSSLVLSFRVNWWAYTLRPLWAYCSKCKSRGAEIGSDVIVKES